MQGTTQKGTLGGGVRGFKAPKEIEVSYISELEEYMRKYNLKLVEARYTIEGVPVLTFEDRRRRVRVIWWNFEHAHAIGIC